MNIPTNGEQKKLILVVDDSEDIHVVLGWLLEGAGYRVAFAEDGQASLTQAKLYHPDLIVMDLSLPNIDGWEAVEYLRKMPEFRSTPIIALTAHVSHWEEEHARAVGCTAHIGKPFNNKVLLQSIADLLSDGGRTYDS